MHLQMDTSKLLPHRIDPWPSTVMQAMCKCSILFVKCFNNEVIRAFDNKAIKAKINIYLNVPVIAKSPILLVPDLEPRKWPLASINALLTTHDASIACHWRPIICLITFLTTWHASEIAPIWAISLIAKLNVKQKDIATHGVFNLKNYPFTIGSFALNFNCIVETWKKHMHV